MGYLAHDVGRLSRTPRVVCMCRVPVMPYGQAALEDGLSVDHVHNLSRIDRWFLCKLRNIAVMKKVSLFCILQLLYPGTTLLGAFFRTNPPVCEYCRERHSRHLA